MKSTQYYYDVPYFMRTSEFLFKTFTEQKSIEKKLRNCNDAEQSEISALLLQLRHLASRQMDITGALLEGMDFSFDDNFSNENLDSDNGEILDEDSITNVSLSFDGEIIRVFTPLTFKRDWNYSYIFSKSTMIAIEKWEKENNANLFSCIETPFVVSVIRKAHSYNRKTFKDNDNKETGNIINTIVRHANLNDAACVMNFSSKFEQVPVTEKTGMEFIFMSRKTALQHPELVI